jgi:5'-3' exonuclease
MGIKKLSKFLLSHNIITKYKNLDEFVSKYSNINNNYMKICIDASLYIHKYLHSYNDILLGFTNQIIRLLSAKILPIYVFDGKPPKEKNDIIKARINRKQRINNKIKDIETCINNKFNNNYTNLLNNSDELIEKMNKLKRQIVNVNKNDIDNLKKLLDIFEIPYICANSEADIICAELTKKNIAHACLTDDMDLLVFGCKKIIRIIEGIIYEYNLDNILYKLNISYEQFVDMCILIGCDYIKNLKINPELAYSYIKKYNTIYNIDPSIIQINMIDIQNVKNIFINNISHTINITINDSIHFNLQRILESLTYNNFSSCLDYINKYKYKINIINKYSKSKPKNIHHKYIYI